MTTSTESEIAAAPFLAEERLLVLLSLAQTDEREAALARSLAAGVDWEEFARLAELNATVPLVLANLERLEIDAPVLERFRPRADEIRKANEARLRIARELFARFEERNIPVVLLKGVLFAETIYRNPAYKKMNDVDILVRKEDLDAVYGVYEEMRFFSAAELLGQNPRKQEKYSHHAPPFFSRDLACMIGTHWGLITPLSRIKPDYDAIWSRTREVDFYGRAARSMSPEDNLHHLCIHLPYYKAGVRELADLYNLIRQEPIDWTAFLDLVEKARTENLVYHALSLAHRLCPSFEVQEALRRVEPRATRFTRIDTARKTARISQLLRSRSTHLSVIEKAFADLRATKKAGEKWEALLRMWKNMLWPPEVDVARMNSLDRSTAWARLVTPSRIRRVFYRDVGRLLFWVIMTKCAWDVFVATATAPFRHGAEDHSAFAAKIGVTVEDLRRLKEALE